MEKFESYIVKKKESKKSKFLGILGLIGLLGFMILRLIEFISKNEISFGLLYLLFILCFVIGFIGMIIRGITKRQKDYEKIGKLLFRDNLIQIEKESFNIENLSNLRFDYGGIRGEPVTARGGISDGSDNVVYFKYNGKNFRFQFLLDSESHRDKYLKMLETLYGKGIDFVENHFKLGRTYLMEKLSYNEIQEFKSKYSS